MPFSAHKGMGPFQPVCTRASTRTETLTKSECNHCLRTFRPKGCALAHLSLSIVTSLPYWCLVFAHESVGSEWMALVHIHFKFPHVPDSTKSRWPFLIEAVWWPFLLSVIALCLGQIEYPALLSHPWPIIGSFWPVQCRHMSIYRHTIWLVVVFFPFGDPAASSPPHIPTPDFVVLGRAQFSIELRPGILEHDEE